MSSNPNIPNPGNAPVGNQPASVINPPVPDPVTPPANPNPGTPQDWEAMYKGLQVTYNKLFNSNGELQTKHNNLNVEHEQVKQELEKTKQDLVKATGLLTEKDKSLLEKQTTVDTTASDLKRVKLIAKKYPMLMEMEEQGLFAGLKPEEAELKLQALQSSINTVIDNKAKTTYQNTPPSTTIANEMPPVLNADELYEKIKQLAGSKDPKDMAEYERLYNLYLELQKNPTPVIQPQN